MKTLKLIVAIGLVIAASGQAQETGTISSAAIGIEGPSNLSYYHPYSTTSKEIKLVDGKLVVTYRNESPNLLISDGFTAKQSFTILVWREIYSSKDGKIVLEKTEQAVVIPAQTTTTPEKVEWK